MDQIALSVGVLGVNHKCAELSLRECLAKTCQRRFGAENSLHGEHSFVLLSTCNRTEVYFHSENLAATHSYLLSILRRDIAGEFEHTLYTYFGADCFLHCARVTAGLDSALTLETEIQGQIKQAYEVACSYVSLPGELHFMFQKSLKLGKQVRNTLPVAKAELPCAVMQIAKDHLQQLSGKKLLVVGASNINSSILKVASKQGFSDIALCSRAPHVAEEMILGLPARCVSWSEHQAWQDYDLVILGTNHHQALLTVPEHACIETTVIVDLSVPRIADPALSQVACVHLYNIDDVDSLVAKSRASLSELIDCADAQIQEAIKRHVLSFQNKKSVHQVLSFSKTASIG